MTVKLRIQYLRIRAAKRLAKLTMKTAGIIICSIYLILPLIYRYTPTLQRHLVFLPFLRWPKGVDFNTPEREGLIATRNFYLESEPGVSVGVWHVLPKSLTEDAKGQNSDFFDESLSGGLPIVLYMHGNSGSRANEHRLELYKILQSLDCHVIAFDYRGYADSSQVEISETGVVADAKTVYFYVKSKAKNSPIFVWGHSLGTGVASRTVGDLCRSGEVPQGLLLESPFNNIRDEVRSHPMSYIYRPVPGFDWFFTDPLKTNDLAFESDRHISSISCPIIILHAQDDAVVPFPLGKKLYHSALENRPDDWPAVEFIEFDASRGYAHKYICRAPELPSIVKEFMAASLNNKWRQKA